MKAVPAHSISRRTEQRTTRADILYVVRFSLHVGTEVLPVEVVNYHHRGACLKLQNITPLRRIESLESGYLNYYMGKKLLREKMPFRICWESLASDGQFGVEFLEPFAPYVHRPHRFPTHPHYSPTVTAIDPLDPHRELFFRVENISKRGMLLLTSLTNRHLMTGMELTRSTGLFPGHSPINLRLRICATRRKEKENSFLLGVEILNPPATWDATIQSYLSTLSPQTHNRSRVEVLSEENLLSKGLKKGLSYKIVQSPEAYNDVLNLRFLAYKSHGKLKIDATPKDQGDGLDKEGIILAGYLGGELIATMELRFSDSGHPLRLKSLFEKSNVIDFDWERTVEINKFAIHPGAQGSDIVVGMMQKSHGILTLHGGYDVVILSTDKLASLYTRVGFKHLGLTIPHPSLPNVTLQVMRLKREVYLNARYINAYAWKVMFEDHQEFRSAIGLGSRTTLSTFQKMQIPIFKVLSTVQQWSKKTFKKKKK